MFDYDFKKTIFFYSAELPISLPFSKYFVFFIEKKPQKITLSLRELDCEFSSVFLFITYLAYCHL